MLNIKFDPTRPKEQGQYFVELVDIDPTDSEHINRFGYWCDVGHFSVAIYKPVMKMASEIMDNE